MYSYGNEKPLTTFSVSDSLFTKSVVDIVGIDDIDSITLFKEIPDYMLNELSRMLGNQAAQHFIPTWKTSERLLFVSYDSRMQEARGYAANRRWKKAESIWTDELEKKTKPVIGKIKKALGDKVKDVKLSRRLLDSPSCIVADENDPTIQMAQMLKAMGQAEMPEIKPILEVNGEHPIVMSLQNIDDEQAIADVAGILLDQALLVEGIKLKDPAAFVKSLNRLLARQSTL
jgi:hypothetical protein